MRKKYNLAAPQTPLTEEIILRGGVADGQVLTVVEGTRRVFAEVKAAPFAMTLREVTPHAAVYQAAGAQVEQDGTRNRRVFRIADE